MIRVGIGGWTFEPWRGPFYPDGLPHARELAHASRQVTAIEINGTFYGSQKPESFRRWAAETPDDFVFSLKAPRFAVNRRILAEAGQSIQKFMGSGIVELGPKLGPILWQLAPTKVFDPSDLGAFLALLPDTVEGVPLRHVLEVRHASFLDPAFVALVRERGMPVVLADSDVHPMIADVTGAFVYARLQRAREEEATGYPPDELDTWAARFKTFAGGGVPDDLPRITADAMAAATPRDCFVFAINGAKVRAPAAAMALLERLGLEAAA